MAITPDRIFDHILIQLHQRKSIKYLHKICKEPLSLKRNVKAKPANSSDIENDQLKLPMPKRWRHCLAVRNYLVPNSGAISWAGAVLIGHTLSFATCVKIGMLIRSNIGSKLCKRLTQIFVKNQQIFYVITSCQNRLLIWPDFYSTYFTSHLHSFLEIMKSEATNWPLLRPSFLGTQQLGAELQ